MQGSFWRIPTSNISHSARKIPLPPKPGGLQLEKKEGIEQKNSEQVQSLPLQGIVGMRGRVVTSQNKAFRKKSGFTSLASGRGGQAREVNEGDI